MLFISHLGLVASIILGMSYSRYHVEWDTKVEHLAQLSASHLSSQITFFSVSVAGRNYANLLMRSTTDNLKAIPKLKFVEVAGHSDYSNHNIGVRYQLNINTAWRTDVSLDEIAQAEGRLKLLSSKLSTTSINDDITHKKLTYLINKAKTDLDALNDSVSLQSTVIPEKPSDIESTKYYLDLDKQIMHVYINLRNKNGGNIWAVMDASHLSVIQNHLIKEVIKEALIAIFISSLLIYMVTIWLVSPLKKLSISMKEDIEKIDQSEIPEIHRIDEIGDLARSYSSLITKIKNQLKGLQNQTETDPLTRLGSRYKYQNYATDLIYSSLKKGELVYFVLCDIDNFKRFNDTYGHTEGDNALTSVASAMQKTTQPHELSCRLGGEEFVFILTGSDENQLKKRVKDIHQSVIDLAIPHTKNSPYQIVTISIGAVLISPNSGAINHENIQTLLDVSFTTADSQLYVAKDKGRNRVEFENVSSVDELLNKTQK